MESMIITREKVLEKIKTVFERIAIEGHLYGSIARGNTDIYSDIDIFLTFKEEDFISAKEARFKYYTEVGEVLHICEAPQNSPIGGIFSSVIYKTNTGLLVVDYSLCPLSTSYRTDEYKHLFGNIELPIGQFQYNPEKVFLPETYRLDFFISIINGSIKKLLRKDENALDFLIIEYQNLKDRYSVPVETLGITGNTFTTLEDIIQKIKKVATEEQQKILVEIEDCVKSFL